MRKINILRPSLLALLASLALILILSAPLHQSSAQTPPPSTPAQERYGSLLSRLAQPAAGSQPAQPPLPNAPQQPGNDIPNKLEYTGLVFSSLNAAAGYDEEIYYLPGFRPYLNAAPVRLTRSPGADFEPRLNQTSTRVVFTSLRGSTQAGTVANIYTVGVDGSGEQALTSAASGVNCMPAFSPDGSKIVFVSDRDGSADIYTMAPDGSSVTRLTTAPELDVTPSFSPDGTKIAWVRVVSEGAGDLMVMNADGSDQHAILSGAALLDRPVWSPSGARIAFVTDTQKNGWQDIAVVSASGIGEILHVASYPGTDQELGSFVNSDNELIYSNTYYRYDELQEKWVFTGTRVFVYKITEQQPDPLLINGNSSYEFNPYAQSRDDTPPASYLYPAPAWSQEGSVSVRYHAADNLAGLHSFTLYWSTDGVTFGYPNLNTYWNSSDWPTEGSAWVASTTDTYVGQTLYFTSQAMDHAGNLETAKTVYETFTRVYKWMASFTVTDLRGYPVNGAQVSVSLAPIEPPVTAPDGRANAYFSDWGARAVEYLKPGYVSPPNPELRGPDSTEAHPHRVLESVMTGPDEQVTNGAFDAAPDALAGWQQSGNLPTTSTAGRLTGMASRTGGACAVPFCLSDPINVMPIKDLEVDSQGRLHVIYADSWYGILHRDGTIDSWGRLPFTADDSTPIQFGPGDKPYFLKDWKLYLWTGSAWTVEDLPAMDHPYYALRPVMDSSGRLHLMYNERPGSNTWYGITYLVREPNGQWTVRRPFINQTTSYDAPFYAVTSDGTLHVVYGLCPAHYAQVKPDFTVTPVETFTMPNCYASHVALRAAPNDTLYLVSGGPSWPTYGWVAKVRAAGGAWADLGPGSIAGGVRAVRVSADSHLFVGSSESNKPLNLSIVLAGGSAFQTAAFPSEALIATRFAAGPGKEIHFTYLNSTNGTTHAYRTGTGGSSAGSGELTQHIQVPASMTAPTLSFFLKFDTPDGAPTSRFKALFIPDGGEPVTLLDRQAASGPWAHLWADLTPFLGQEGTLSFKLEQQGGESPVYAMADEVSVSSWHTPVIARFGPPRLAFPLAAEQWVDLFGENFDPAAEVFLDGVKLQSEWVDAGHLRVLVPAATPQGRAQVRVANPSGGDSIRPLWVGSFIYLPAITR